MRCSINLFAQKQTVTRPASGFTAPEIIGPFEVIISPDGNEKLTVEGTSNQTENIKTEVVGEKLTIRYSSGDEEDEFFGGSGNKVMLSVRQLKQIIATGRAKIVLQSPLRVSQTELQINAAVRFSGRIEAGELSVVCTGGALAELQGKADMLTLRCSNASKIEAADFLAVRCRLHADSGSRVEVGVKDEIDAFAESGSNIRYKGNPDPKRTKIRTASGGSVSKIK